MSFQVAYVPIGVGTFHLESAQDQFEKSIAMLKGLNADCTVPEKMLLTINDLDAYLDTLNPNLIVLQNITFANAALRQRGAQALCLPHCAVAGPAGSRLSTVPACASTA